MTPDPIGSEESRLRPRLRIKVYSIHWIVIEYASIAGFLGVGGVHGRGASALLSAIVLSALAGVVHAMVEIAVADYRGRVHPFFVVALLLLPFLGMAF